MLLLSPALAAPAAGQDAGAAPPPGAFVVRPGDLLRIRVWPDSILSGEFPVEETGVVYLPGLGQVRAGGRTLAELRAELRAGYGRRLKSPVVTVVPIFGVAVLGAVIRPGEYQMTATDNLYDAIARAGGLRDDATGEVRLIRGGRTVRLTAEAALGSDAASDAALALQSGDRIVVPRKGFRLRVTDLLLLAQTAAIIVSIATR
jgi:polysaccharide export outer membrane protein